MAAAAAPPDDYEALIRLIHERHGRMSRTHQAIALHLTQNPTDVALRSVNALAADCGIHASSFVRFAQALGFPGFRDLQALFRRRLTTAAPGFEARARALEAELGASGAQSGAAFLGELAARDIAALRDLAAGTDAAALAHAARLLDEAGTVYLAGQLRSAPVAELMRYILTMLGKRCILLDSGGGLATHVARTMTPQDALFAVSFRFYATEVVNIVEEAAARGVPVVAVSDSTLSPLARSSTVLFAVPEHGYTFSRSLAAPMCLVQALALSVAARRQAQGATPRIPTVTAP
ncbi:MAG: MurR/RpiR family transcriptional regulator [Rhodobacteraceae bacterium]|nr:MurR/RpiR family transcriptional regulator [Paracoccaceae bacterium]